LIRIVRNREKKQSTNAKKTKKVDMSLNTATSI
jgi:hypothetical protein